MDTFLFHIYLDACGCVNDRSVVCHLVCASLSVLIFLLILMPRPGPYTTRGARSWQYPARGRGDGAGSSSRSWPRFR